MHSLVRYFKSAAAFTRCEGRFFLAPEAITPPAAETDPAAQSSLSLHQPLLFRDCCSAEPCQTTTPSTHTVVVEEEEAAVEEDEVVLPLSLL